MAKTVHQDHGDTQAMIVVRLPVQEVAQNY